MTEKQKHALDKIIDALPGDCRESFREIAEYAISLGYMPILKGAKKDYVDFSKSKVKRTILKIDAAPTPPRLAIKFFAAPAYSAMFRGGIEKIADIVKQMGYEGCYGCGSCDGTQGYKYVLSDGCEKFLCGKGLIDLPLFNAESIPEVKAALKAQDDFFMGNTV
jgi:hypothetical protein